MKGGLSPTNPTLQAAFKQALLNQGELALLIFVTLAIAWVACRELLPARTKLRLQAMPAAWHAEPSGRRLLRIGFGVLWVFDAILQAQPAMPGGLTSLVIGPATAGSPEWLRHLVNWAATGWSYHPVQDAAAAVWIQLGIGAWLIAVPGGRWSRLAGLASVAWGLQVWIFGEALGGMLAPGWSVLFGAPGAALVYCAAGALIALPDRYWQSQRLGQRTLQVIGGCLVAFAVTQAWPGRGFWQGRLHGQLAPLAAMINSMASTPQPAPLAHLLSDFGSFAAAHGFVVNLTAVVVLAATGACLLTGRLTVIRPAVVLLLAFFLADWVLVEDLGFLGGVGTDPNSMVPLCLLVLGSFLAFARPAIQAQAAMADSPPAAASVTEAESGVQRRKQMGKLADAFGRAPATAVVALWAGGIIALGATPMAMAETSRTADPIIATALNGSPATLNTRAAAFDLTDQDGRQVSLASLRGKVVLLTFLDPVCTNDCPLLAQEFKEADQVLGNRVGRVALVAIVANPVYRSLVYTRAFDAQEQLSRMPNWLFLTGSLQQLTAAWHDYFVTAQLQGAGAMVLHPDIAYVIDARGFVRTELNMDPGPATVSSQSSFAVLLAQAAERVMP